MNLVEDIGSKTKKYYIVDNVIADGVLARNCVNAKRRYCNRRET